MYRRILVPVDLEHLDQLEKALNTAADLAKHYETPVTYVGVTTETPSSVAHTPEEFASKLAAFAARQGEAHGLSADSKAAATPDPSTDLDKALLKSAEETGADLIVMASHKPNIADWFWASHGGDVAKNAGVSVFLVR